MSERTAASALASMVATGLDEEELGLEMCALLETIDFDYERWCRILGLDPDDEATFETYMICESEYPNVWTLLGQRQMDKEMAARGEKWRRIIGARESSAA